MTSVRAYLHTTVAAMAIAFGVLSAPANATVSTPFGSISAGGFAISPQCLGMTGPARCFGLGGASDQQALSISTPFGGFSGPGFGISFGPFGGNFGGFGLGNAGPGASGNYTGFGVSTPWGGFSGPVFGIGGPGYFGLNEQQALSVRTPWGGFSGPGFGIPLPGVGFSPFFGLGNGGPGAGGYYTGLGIGNVGGVPSPGMSNQQALSVSTPWGGASIPGFGVSPAFGGWGLGGPGYPPGVVPFFGLGNGGPGAGGYYTGFGLPSPVPMTAMFGISTPWGGMNMGGFGIGGQQPQVMPIYLPNPY